MASWQQGSAKAFNTPTPANTVVNDHCIQKA